MAGFEFSNDALGRSLLGAGDTTLDLANLVLSVNARTGNVTLTTANIAESGNLYFTNARSIGAFTAGSGITIAANGLISANVGSLDLSNANVVIMTGVDSVNGANGNVVLTTSNIAEGANLYFTNARVYANVLGLGYATVTQLSTNLAVKANITDLSTSNVIEGANLYFTNARARAAISITGSGTYDNSTGIITITAGSGDVVSVNGANGTVILSTANIAESGNLYFTNIRVWSNVTASISTSYVPEGANLYFTNARVYDNVISLGYITGLMLSSNLDTKANITDLNTSNIIEGANLYFTNARVYANVVELGYATNSYVDAAIANISIPESIHPFVFIAGL